jgi:LmbE family N-acetylglucosaminyl deacetylase
MVGPILIVVAHMDDECFMGATIARFCAEGHRVVVMPLADSETSRRSATQADVATRIERAAKCTAILVHDLRVPQPLWPDQCLDTVPLLDLTRAIESAIEDIKPVTVFTHSPGDLNADHRRTYEAVLPAVRPKSGVKAVYCFEGPAMALPFEPVAFWQVMAADLDKQRAAMACYHDELGAEWDLLNARAVVYGYRVGVPLAQGFEVVRELR